MNELKQCPFCGGDAEKDTLRERSYLPPCVFLITPTMSTFNANSVGLRVEFVLPSKMQQKHGTAELVIMLIF